MRLLAWERKQHLVRSVFRRILARSNPTIQVVDLFHELKWSEPKFYAAPKLRVHGALYQRPPPTRYHFVTHKRRDSVHYPIRTYIHSDRQNIGYMIYLFIEIGFPPCVSGGETCKTNKKVTAIYKRRNNTQNKEYTA
jgi:hypothetical protein